jgi:hypothetical protein
LSTPKQNRKSKEKSNFNMQLGKAQEKTVQRKLIIRSRRSTTLLCHPELEGALVNVSIIYKLW